MLRGPWIFGLLVIGICFGGFGTWASTAKLSAAAIASGRISPDGSQRIIQHLEGGIVASLKVREGDLVSKGDTLVLLDPVQAQANFDAKNKKLRRLRVTRERLMAVQRGSKKFVENLSEASENIGDPAFVDFLENEQALFALGAQMKKEQSALYLRQEQQVENEIESIRAEIEGLKGQLKFIDLEIEAKRQLTTKGLVRLPDLYSLERKQVELSSKESALAATIARAQQKIEEIRISRLGLETELQEKTSDELAQVNREIAQTEEAFDATDDVLGRTNIVSPIDGRVLHLHMKTLGGVARGGEPIVTIVPVNEDLIVDARLSPADIDNVHIGMEANVQVTSFMARHLLPLTGKVVHVGADVVVDSDSNETYFPMRIEVSPEDLERMSADVSLQAGMPADIFIQTGTHTPLRYILDPVRKSFSRAFREEAL